MAERDEKAKDAKVEPDSQSIEDLDVAEGEAAKVVGGMIVGGMISEPGATELLA